MAFILPGKLAGPGPGDVVNHFAGPYRNVGMPTVPATGRATKAPFYPGDVVNHVGGPFQPVTMPQVLSRNAGTVYNSRAPGAVNFLPAPAGQSQGSPGAISLPQAGSPLMQQLIKFVQARNPAIVVNEGNVQANLPQRLDVLPGTNFRVPGAGRDLLRQLYMAGLARPERTLSPTDFVSSSPVMRENAINQQRIRMQMGLRPVTPYVDQFAHLNMWQPPAAAPVNASGGGVSAPMVPVNTLPEPVPAGGMVFPPQPTNPLFGSQDPRRNYLFR